MMGTPTLLVKWQLCRLPSSQFFRPPAAISLQPIQPHIPRSIDKKHDITFPLQTGLKQQRRVNDKRDSVGRGRRKELKAFFQDPWMGEFLQTPSFVFISKNDRGDRLPVRRTVGSQNPSPPPGRKLRLDGWVFEGLATKRVGIAHHAPPTCQQPRDLALASADSAGQSDDNGAAFGHDDILPDSGL